MTLEDLETRFAHVSAERTHHRDQQLGTVACREALAAAAAGNYGVGAVLVDPKGMVVEQGRNSLSEQFSR
jgi:tRNA(Arg) A34 adenosine deaminase TadA